MRFVRPILAVMVLGGPAVVPSAAMAHGGEAAISVFPAQAAAGADVMVFGEDLEPDAAMELHLLTADGEVLVGEPTTDEVGHFSLTLTLPDALTERTYEMRLMTPSGDTSSTFVTVVGTQPEVAEGGATAPSDIASGLLLAGILGLGGIGLLVLTLRPARGRRRAR